MNELKTSTKQSRLVVGYKWHKPVPTHAISVMDIGGNGEYSEE